MRRFVILSLALAAVLASGCDFMRAVAGRPTSRDLEVKRAAMEKAREEAVLQARMDSLARVRAREDSLAALEAHLRDSLSKSKGLLLTPARLGGLNTTELKAKYYIIVGAFQTRAYAERKLGKCEEAGYPAVIIAFRNGYLAIGACPSDSLYETMKYFRELRGNGICPADGWILVNE